MYQDFLSILYNSHNLQTKTHQILQRPYMRSGFPVRTIHHNLNPEKVFLVTSCLIPPTT
jgi:hypothetical protein